jgi:hypothetical protein
MIQDVFISNGKVRCGFQWEDFGAGGEFHVCYLDPGHIGSHDCHCRRVKKKMIKCPRCNYEIRKEFPELRHRLPTLWTRSYFVSTHGNITADSIKRYIEEQKGL